MAGQTPDVRIRLSAEGVQEVVSAFKRIQAEADRAGRQSRTSAEGHAFLAQQLTSLKALLPTIAIGGLVTGFVALARSGLELADNLGKLQQKTALNADTLSAWSFAARYADVEQQSLGKGLVKFTRAMDDYDKGSSTVRAAIKSLFGSARALEGLPLDQRLQKIAGRMAELGPSTTRTGAAIALFGKAGADLLPVIDELGAQGFEQLRDKAQKLGVAVNEEAVASAENLKRALITLKTESQGLATQFLMGLAPQLANMANAVTDATAEKGTSGFKRLGEYAGYVISGIVSAFLIVGKTIGFVLNEGRLLWDDFGAYAKDTLQGVWTQTKMVIGSTMMGGNPFALLGKADLQRWSTSGSNQFLTRLALFAEDTQKSVAALFAKPPVPVSRKGAGENEPGTGDAAAAAKAARAAQDLAQAEADARLKVLSAEQKQLEAAEKERYEKGLSSLREYYAARLAIVQQQGQAEIAAIEGKLKGLQAAPLGEGELPDERQAKIVALQADLAVKRLDLQQQLNNLQADEARETEALNEKALDAERRLARTTGERHVQARAAIDAEAAQYDSLLRKMGIADAERARRVAAYTEAGYQGADFEELQRQASAALAAVDTARARIDQQVQAGMLFEFEGEQQRMALERDRLPRLRAIADEMRRAAITPEQIQAAEQFSLQVGALAVNSDKAAREMAEFKRNVEQALTGDLTTWLSSSVDQAETLGDVFRSLAASIVASLRQIAAQMLATWAIQKLLGFFGMAVGAPTGGGKALGGMVRGPGTSTSDSIPARLSNGEYVVRAAAVRQPGVRELLDGLNFGTPIVRRMPRPYYAEGGLVDLPTGGAPRDPALSATIGLDEGLLLKRLEASPEFRRVVIRTTQANRKAMQRALGDRS